MRKLRMPILMVVCLIAVAVACSSGEPGGGEMEAPQTQARVREAPVATSVPSAGARVVEPSPTIAPEPTAVAVSTSTSVPATPAPTSTAEPAPTAAPAGPAPQSAATSDESAPATVSDEERDLKIVTLLPFDAIPAILEPEFVSAEEADAELEPQSLVMGLSIDGDHRAYSIPTLSSHEIVNDTVGGKPVAVTW